MAVNLKASILSWSCFPAPESWRERDTVGSVLLSAEGLNTDFIPSALRRRCSTLSKVTLAVAHAAAGDRSLASVPTVFSSAHGESEITAALLRDLATDQQLSPMGFSLSVHNAASGLFSIATGNTAASTAIAAGANSFAMGLCESLLLVADNPETPVLYVCSDDRVPDVFLRQGDANDKPLAVALLLSGSDSNIGCRMQVTVGDKAEERDDSSPTQSAVSPVEMFVRWLSDETLSVRLCDDGSVWTCQAGTPRAALYRPSLRN